MDERTAKLVEDLANKLGTTAEHLWQVLVRQAPIDAITHLAIGLILAGLWYAMHKLHKKFSKKYSVPRYPGNSHLAAETRETTIYDESEIATILPMSLSFIAMVIITAVWVCYLDIAIAGVLNPEYWALHKVMMRIH